jgi:hypothetical protein
LVWTPGTVKIAAGCNVEDLSADSQVDGLIVLAIEGEKCWWGEGSEDDRCGGGRKGGFWFGAKLVVEDREEEGEENKIDWGCDCLSGRRG